MVKVGSHISTDKLSRKKEIALVSYIIALLGYVIYLLIFSRLDQVKDYSIHVYVLNWVGIFSFGYILLSWKKLTMRVFTPYIIFMSFFFFFHYGQPIMWAFGIHIPNEIGKQLLYQGFGVPTSLDILYAQTFTILSMLMFHLGAVISHKKSSFRMRKYKYRLMSEKKGEVTQDNASLKSILYVCTLIGLISIPLQLFVSSRELIIALTYGYKALYYSEFASTSANSYSVFLFMFFPCLIGLLIGSKFNRKVSFFVYLVFGVYALLNLFSGDRGSWLYKTIILIWVNHISYKPVNTKKFLRYLLLGFFGLYLVNAIVMVRDVGITIENVIDYLSFEKSTLITAFFVMGGSKQPMMVLQKYGWDIWPHGNTYILALVGMVTNRIFDVLGIPFELLSSYFSQSYLGISWGAGFSIIAEALLNFGPYFSPLFMIILGWIITKITDLDLSIEYTAQPLRVFFAASSLEVLISINRNVVHIPIKSWFYGVVLLSLAIVFVRRLIFGYSRNFRYYSKGKKSIALN